MKRVEKRLLSWLMVVAMVLSVIHTSAPMVVHAEDMHGITLGVPSWNTEHTTYSFTDVTVNMTAGTDKQKVFCISVSDDGYFEADLSGIYDSLDISGVRVGGKYADNSGADPDKVAQLSKTDKEKLFSVTILGDITDEEIKTFIKSLVFYRNGVAIDKEQKVSVVSSEYDVRTDGGTALALEGKLHVYKYIDWETAQEQKYKGTTEAISIPASKVADDSTKWTWFKAYELAKQETLNGLKGYLSTITSDEEQMFIYNKFGALSTTSANKNGAWIGGARTYAATNTDASEKSDCLICGV